MVDPVKELKIRAEVLHTRLAEGDRDARARLRALPELARATEADVGLAASRAQKKHCLAVVARELGFATWDHARRVLSGDADELDFGTLLYGSRGADLNVWFVDYAEARAHLEAERGAGRRRILLAYRRQFFLVDPTFVTDLGLDPDDPDWAAIDDDWARPRDRAARQRLVHRRVVALRGEK